MLPFFEGVVEKYERPKNSKITCRLSAYCWFIKYYGMFCYYTIVLLSNYGGYKNAFLTTKFSVPSLTFYIFDGVNEDYIIVEKPSILFVLMKRPCCWNYLLGDFSSYDFWTGFEIICLNISLGLLLAILFNGGNSNVV